MSDQIKIEDALKVCLAHGYIPLPKQSLQNIIGLYDLVEAAMGGIVKLQSTFAAIKQGQSISQETAQRNYDAIKAIEKFATEKKPQYAAVKTEIDKLLNMAGGISEDKSGYIIGPFDYDAIFESDVWNVFNALGEGYEIWLIEVYNGPTLWCIPPNEQYNQFYMDVDSIAPLEENDLVIRIDIKDLPEEKVVEVYHSTKVIYKISEKGKHLYDEIKAQAAQAESKDLESQRIFKTKINLSRHL